jgi:hypothetical protein
MTKAQLEILGILKEADLKWSVLAMVRRETILPTYSRILAKMPKQ